MSADQNPKHFYQRPVQYCFVYPRKRNKWQFIWYTSNISRKIQGSDLVGWRGKKET